MVRPAVHDAVPVPGHVSLIACGSR